MLGFSWAEILLTSAVALVVIGPKDIPKVMFEIGRVVRRLQYVKFALSQQFEDLMKEHDLHDLRHDVNFEAPRYNPVVKDAEMEADAGHLSAAPVETPSADKDATTSVAEPVNRLPTHPE